MKAYSTTYHTAKGKIEIIVSVDPQTGVGHTKFYYYPPTGGKILVGGTIPLKHAVWLAEDYIDEEDFQEFTSRWIKEVRQ